MTTLVVDDPFREGDVTRDSEVDENFNHLSPKSCRVSVLDPAGTDCDVGFVVENGFTSFLSASEMREWTVLLTAAARISFLMSCKAARCAL